MKIAVYNQLGEKKEDLVLSSLFDNSVCPKAITLYINYLRAALRAPIANTKDRAEVSGGGKKPWRQKGTGNARVGSNRSPLWVGGGVTFGPTSDRNFKKKINSREKKRVLLGIFADLIANKKLVIMDSLKLSEIKSKKASELLEKINSNGKISVIVGTKDENAMLSFRNLAGVKIMTPAMIDPIYLLSSNRVVVSKSALDAIEKRFSAVKDTSENIPEKIAKVSEVESE